MVGATFSRFLLKCSLSLPSHLHFLDQLFYFIHSTHLPNILLFVFITSNPLEDKLPEGTSPLSVLFTTAYDMGREDAK